MGEIRVDVEIRGVNEAVKVNALVDTGARNNFLRRTSLSGKTVDELGISVFRGKKAIWLADSSRVDGDLVEFPEMILLRRRVSAPPFVVLGDLREDAIIGHLTMQSLDLHLRPKVHTVWPGSARRSRA